MKTRLLRVLTLGTTITGLVLCTGCQEDKAQGNVPVVTSAPAVVGNVESPELAPAPSLETPPPVLITAQPNGLVAPVLDTNPTNVTVVQEAVTPEDMTSSPALGHVVKLVQSGVGDEVILTYVKASPDLFNVGPDQIIYLNDLGVSSPVITALIQHDASPEMQSRKQAAQPVAPATAAPPAPVATQPVVTTPATATLPPAYQEAAPVTTYAPVQTEQQPVTVNYFYNYLTPYGNWVQVDGYGLCWQPTVAVANVNWRPYGDSGRWLWTDNGWYWYSDYSWGWAPFHYGRWCHGPRFGWIWVPDTHWGPAWVSWRYTDDYYGWAPLPPTVAYVSGGGLYYHGSSFGIGFDFGLTDFWYTFIPSRHFCHHDPHLYYVNRREVPHLYATSHVRNDYTFDHDRVVNHGISVDRVKTATRGEIPRAAIHDSPLPARPNTRFEKIQNRGSMLVVERPTLPTTPAVRTAIGSPGTHTPGPGLAVKPAGLTAKPASASPAAAAPVGGSPAVRTKNPVHATQFPTAAPAPTAAGPTRPVADTKVPAASLTSPTKQDPAPSSVRVNPGSKAVSSDPPRNPSSTTRVPSTTVIDRRSSTPATTTTPAPALKSGQTGVPTARSIGSPSSPSRTPAVTTPASRGSSAPKLTAPSFSAGSPEYSTRAPVRTEVSRPSSAPAMTAPAGPPRSPSYSAPAPSVSTPPSKVPSYSAPAGASPSRSYSAPAPAYSAPSKAPSYSAPPRAPSYSAPAPSYSAPARAPAPAPSYSSPPRAPAPAPSYSAPAPSRSSSPSAAPSSGRGRSDSGNSGGGGGRKEK